MAEQPEHGETDDRVEGSVSRRKVIAGAAGLLAGAVVADAAPGLAADAGAATPEVTPDEASLLLGQTNVESATTSLINDTDNLLEATGLEVYTQVGGGFAAIATPSVGVIGATGLYGVTTTNLASQAGVAGVSSRTMGALGAVGLGSIGGGLSAAAGVVGYANPSTVTATGGLTMSSVGVLGVIGSASTGAFTAASIPAGVQGIASGRGVVGVEAVNGQDGLALRVLGNASFSTSGLGLVPAASSAVAVLDPGVTDLSRIFVTLTGNPHDAGVSWVKCLPGFGFELHLTEAVVDAVSFCWFRID